jgi:hypothetical protein
LVIITKNHVAEMLRMLQIGIIKLSAMRFGQVTNLCWQMALVSAFMQKEGWRFPNSKESV